MAKKPRKQTRGAQIGARLRIAREEEGWTLDEARHPLSKELGRTPPISVQALSGWERGDKRSDFFDWELAAFSRVFKRPVTFFTSDEASPATIRSLIATIDDDVEAVPLVSFEDVAAGKKALDEAVQKSLASGRLYRTHYPLPADKFTFEWADSSMEPMLIDGNSKVTILRRVTAQPDHFVLIRYGKSIYLRPYRFEGDEIALIPMNKSWQTLRFSPEEWEESVEIMGVLYSYETRVFRVKNTR